MVVIPVNCVIAGISKCDIHTQTARNRIVTAIAVDGVVTVISSDLVVAGAAIDPVMSFFSLDQVVIISAIDRIVAVASVDTIISIASGERVVSSLAKYRVVARITVYGVIAQAAIYLVVPAPSVQVIIPISPYEDVVVRISVKLGRTYSVVPKYIVAVTAVEYHVRGDPLRDLDFVITATSVRHDVRDAQVFFGEPLVFYHSDGLACGGLFLANFKTLIFLRRKGTSAVCRPPQGTIMPNVQCQHAVTYFIVEASIVWLGNRRGPNRSLVYQNRIFTRSAGRVKVRDRCTE